MSFIKLILSLLFTLIFLLPSIIAVKKQHPHKVAIIFVNIFGSLLYGIGWGVAFIWCFLGDPPNKLLSWGAETYRAQKESFGELTIWGKTGVVLGMICLVGLWCAGCLFSFFF